MQVKFNLFEIQDIVVLSDIFPMLYQVTVPTKLQKKIFLVVDKIVVASFANTFPNQLYKEALLQVNSQI